MDKRLRNLTNLALDAKGNIINCENFLEDLKKLKESKGFNSITITFGSYNSVSYEISKPDIEEFEKIVINFVNVKKTSTPKNFKVYSL